MGYMKGDDRNQTIMYNLEDEISADNPVRLMDLLVDKLVAENSERYKWKGHAIAGRPAYSAAQLLKLYLYGYSNRIASSRRLEAECRRNIELKWLMHNLAPDFKTIADYRRDNPNAIHEVAVSFRIILKEWGFISGKLMALDGTKLKANAGSTDFSHERIRIMIDEHDAEIGKYLHLLTNNDIQDDLRESNDSSLLTVDGINARMEELKRQKAQLEEYLRISGQDGQRRINPTDPEARFIRTRRDRFNGYNLQVIADSLHKLIASAEIRQANNDRKELIPAMETMKDELGLEPEVLVADQGYDNILLLQEAEDCYNTEIFVAVGAEPSEKSPGAKFTKSDFVFDSEQDVYFCPAGQQLTRRSGVHRIKRRDGVVYSCSVLKCRQCEFKSRCSKDKAGKKIVRYVDEAWVESFRARMHSERGKELIKRRKAIVEHVFGVLKCWMGKIPLLLRGRKKVQTEIDLYTTAYNLKRLINLIGFDKVRDMILSMKLPEIMLKPEY